MAHTVIFGMLQEEGHLHPTFKLARQLSRQGLDVAYFAAPKLRGLVQAQGFRTLPWFDDLWVDADAAKNQSLFLERRVLTRRFREMTRRLCDGQGPVASLVEQGPVLVAVDVTLPTLAFALRAHGFSQVLVHTSLPQTRDPGVPPLRSRGSYRVSWSGRIHAAIAWRRFLATRSLSARAVSTLGLCPPYELARRVAPRFAIAPAELDRQTVFMPQLRGLPELVLCPKAFDSPRTPRCDRHYIESVDLERREDAFPWHRLSAGLPLVYASLGRQVYRRRAARRFLSRLVRVFEGRPEWQLVLATGGHLSPSDVGDRFPNIVAVEKAPQLALLQRARAMVTHGGLGSIKECVLYGVPMLVFPLAVDQPGNAARVSYHGLGRAGSITDTDERALSTMLLDVLQDEAYRERVAKMQQRFLQVERAGSGAAWITHRARRPPQAASSQ